MDIAESLIEKEKKVDIDLVDERHEEILPEEDKINV